jgi:phage FluMu protein gp41
VPAGLAFTLPHGVRVGGEWTRDVRLRALSGAEEEFLAGHGAELLPAERTTELLARCVERIGPLEAAPQTVLGLTVGDREALLLQIRRLTFGDRLDAVVACPSAECGEQMDLELSVRDLLVEPYSNETD